MNKIEFGDCREIMRKWASQGVKAQTCITSPPYYGLRDYGHEGQIGLEETPEQYISAMVEVFRCVWDVLEDDGTLWLNIGDSYAGNNSRASNNGRAGFGNAREKVVNRTGEGLKTKDLIGIPWMLAFALRADGWYLRQDIIWHKPNPIPESVQDRCTKSHEYIFLLSKSQKYHFDHIAIKEPLKGEPESRDKNAEGYQADYAKGDRFSQGERVFGADGMANKRSVWSVPVKPYSGAHFAVFPSELIEPCILAGAPVGGIVLDPFMGSGTTAQVAQDLGRQYIGCELNPEYGKLQKKRTAQTSLDFA
jgi:DNA modification methylase